MSPIRRKLSYLFLIVLISSLQFSEASLFGASTYLNEVLYVVLTIKINDVL